MIVQFPDPRAKRLRAIVAELPDWLVSRSSSELADDILRLAAERAGYTPEEVEKIIGHELKVL